MEVDNPQMTIFVHIEALKHDQAQLAHKLDQERTANSLLRKELAAVQQQWTTLLNKRSQVALDVAEKQVTLAQRLQQVSEIQKSIQEEEACTARVNKSTVQLWELNQERKSKIVTHAARVALYHQRLSDTSERAPVTVSAAQRESELRSLKTENKQLKYQIAQFDKQLLSAVAALEAEKSQLELEIQHAKARIADLKARQSTQKTTEDKAIRELQRALDIQTANNDAVDAENQLIERELFNCSSVPLGANGAPLSPPGGEHSTAATTDWPEFNH